MRLGVLVELIYFWVVLRRKIYLIVVLIDLKDLKLDWLILYILW